MPEPHLSHDRLPTEQIATFGHLAVRSQREGVIHEISLTGEIDLATVGDVERELLRVEATDACVILLDLSGLTFMDSTGIRLLICADARSRADANRLILGRPPDHVMRVLQIAGVADRLPFAG
jgi:anti-sigma B factor antagonist